MKFIMFKNGAHPPALRDFQGTRVSLCTGERADSDAGHLGSNLRVYMSLKLLHNCQCCWLGLQLELQVSGKY